MNRQAITDSPFIEERYPTPPRGQRFRLTRAMHEYLRQHIFGRDLMPLTAGVDCRVGNRRSFSLEPLPGMLIAYCSGGEGELVADGQHHAIKPGDLIVVPKATAIYLAPLADTVWTHHFLVCDGELADQYLAHLGAPAPVCAIGPQPQLTGAIEAIVALRTASLRHDVFIAAASRLRAMLTWLAVVIADAPSDATSDRVDQTLKYMSAKLDGNLDLDELAEMAGLSRYQYVRKFRERHGQSPIHHFIYLKMQRACELLEATAYDVRQIGEMLGYADSLYFSKVFKRTIGQSPQHYRRARVT